MVEQVYISWDEFHKHAKLLAEKIKQTGNYNKIIAISRGGLIPAGIISYELDIADTQAINISSYDNERQKDASEIIVKAEVGNVDEQTLIIDDLSDTGRTFQLVRNMYPKAKLVSVYAKPTGINSVDIYSTDAPDKWIVFPWDL
jgi:xanthine phosphoribosyltransferase